MTEAAGKSPNPFPYLGTLRLAGGLMERGKPVPAGSIMTLSRAPIRRLQGFLDGYLARFNPHWSMEGGLVVIRGEHGSGKTHTIYAVWQNLKDERIFPIYVLQQNDDILSLYHDVVGRMDYALLKQLSRNFLGLMVAKKLSEDLEDAADKARIEQQLKSSPDGPQPGPQDTATAAMPSPNLPPFTPPAPPPPPTVTQLFESYRVERGATASFQRSTLRDLTHGHTNLERAVRHLQGTQFDQQAADWLLAKPVSPEDLKGMGITGPLEKPEDAMAALELLVALFTIGDRALVLIIDQYEKLVASEDPVLAGKNAGWLRSLGETCVARNAMLVLSGNEEAWNRLPADLAQRVELSQVRCTMLSEREATDILRLYLTPKEIKFETGGINFLAPFVDEAVWAMLELGGGNPRRLVQLAWTAYEKALPNEVVDAEFITRMAREDTDQFVDRTMVKRAVEAYLLRQPFRPARHFQMQDLTFDFALLDSQDKPVLLVDVRSAIFQDDEAANAVITAGALARLRNSGSRAAYGLVATGYVSPEVINALASLVTRLIVYRRDTFETEMEALLAETPREAPQHAPPPDETTQQLAVMRELLQKISEDRTQQTVVFSQRGEQLTGSQERQRYEERREKARREWSDHRRTLEAEIQKAHKERIDAGLEELEELRKRAEAHHFWRDIVLGAATLMVAISAGMLPWSEKAQLGLWMIAVSLAGALLWDRFGNFEWPLPDHIRSISDLESLTLRHLPGIAINWMEVQPNPLCRFLRLAHRINTGRIAAQEIPMLLASEPVRLLRQSLCRVFIDQAPKELISSLKPDPRLLHMNFDLMLLLENRELAEWLQSHGPVGRAQTLLCALVTGTSQARHSFSLSLALAATGHESGRLADMFDQGLDRYELDTLSDIPERELREAVREWSPFEEGGLGMLDYSRHSKTIDQIFLFASQLQLYFERDLLDVPPPAPAAIKPNA